MIYRELKRKYEKRLKDKVKRVKFTEEQKCKVNELLKEDYSPEQISGRLRAEGKACVS